MEKNIILLLVFGASLALAEEVSLNINQKIQHSDWAYYENIIITPDEFILTISAYYGSCSFNEFTVENLIPVKVVGYELGTTIGGNSFTVHIPRQYKKLYIRGINRFGRDTKLDLTPYDNYVKARTGRKGLDDTEKPTISVLFPVTKQNVYRTEELYLTTEGKVSDNLGILEFEINGEKVPVNSDGQFKSRLKLKLGQNSILYKATDINNNIQTKDIVIIRDELIEDTQFSDVDFPAATSMKNPNAVAIVFGIEEYRNAPKVTYAVNDADIFREYLIKRMGVSRENIYLRLDEQATKGEFDKVFSQNGWLKRNTNSKSDVIIYFAGHGAPDISSKSSYLIPYDGDANYAASTGYSLNQLYQNISSLNVKTVTIFIDACFSGQSRDAQVLFAEARPIKIELIEGTIPSNTVVFTASKASEISSGLISKKHGVFTYYLLKGLSNTADTNKNRQITVSELKRYLEENVPNEANRLGREQNPQTMGIDLNRVILSY